MFLIKTEQNLLSRFLSICKFKYFQVKGCNPFKYIFKFNQYIFENNNIGSKKCVIYCNIILSLLFPFCIVFLFENNKCKIFEQSEQ
jgi:hypothetical protein